MTVHRGWTPPACTSCGLHPVTDHNHRRCWWCTHPGIDPPPCKICGSTAYFHNNYCRACHPANYQPVKTCTTCFGWGDFAGATCMACYQFNWHHQPGPCRGCGRVLALRRGYCRPCWAQAQLLAGADTQPAHALLAQVGAFHQLTFTDMIRRSTLAYKGRRRLPAPPRPTPPPPPLFPDHQQLTLFDVGRDLSRSRGPRPGELSPMVLAAQSVARKLAAQRGWPDFTRHGVLRGLAIALSGLPAPVLIRYTELAPLESVSISVERTAEVLDLLGILLDDRPDTMDAWLTSNLDGLPEQMRDEVATWVQALRGQLPRTRPRHEDTIRGALTCLRPHLRQWAEQHHSLREITRDHIKTAVANLSPAEIKNTISPMRSLFTTLKQQKVIFRDPVSRFRFTTYRVPPNPITDAELVAIANATHDPERRILFVLAALHAARPVHMRHLQLDDIDLERHWIDIGGHGRPLDQLTYDAVIAYLTHRRRRWPRCSNPHLLVSQQTAYEDGEVSGQWTKARFQGLGATLTRLRQSRYMSPLPEN